MKVALVHDYLREYGGAERVLEVLHEIFPEAPLYTAYYNKKALGSKGETFRGWDIRTSWIQHLPFANKLISPLRIFAPNIFESFNLSEYDLVISSSSAVYFAKSVITKPQTLHISYIHTPPRFLYGYVTSFNYKKHFITRIVGEIMNHYLRIVDFEVSQRPDILVANSKNIQDRIKKFYRRDSIVIYPPVGIDKYPPIVGKMSRKYFLTVGRLVRGKGVDVIIEACGKLGFPLKVVGTGPELENYKSEITNNKNVQFLGSVSDEELIKLYSGAKATILASGDEDFGIVPVESQAAGTPVIAPASGGYLETIIDGKTGILFKGDSGKVTVDSLMEGIKQFSGIKFKTKDCRANARKFSKERFKKEILELIKKNFKKGLDKTL